MNLPHKLVQEKVVALDHHISLLLEPWELIRIKQRASQGDLHNITPPRLQNSKTRQAAGRHQSGASFGRSRVLDAVAIDCPKWQETSGANVEEGSNKTVELGSHDEGWIEENLAFGGGSFLPDLELKFDGELLETWEG